MPLYDLTKQKFLTGTIDLTSDDIRCIAVDAADYTPNYVTDEFLDDVPAGARVSVSGALSGKTVTLGVFDANDITLSTVSGDQFEYILVYQHTGVDTTSELIALFTSGTGLPFTPVGTDITITWDSGVNRIFAL